MRRTPQLELPFPASWGGRRAGAGRKRVALRPQTPHRARPRHYAGNPVHVTLRARLRSLRSQFLFPTVRIALAGAARRKPGSFRIVHFSVQADHVHLIVEAADKRALSSGMRSVAIRVARYVNDLLGQKGRFWADRWHGRALTSPRQVRSALVYVLGNFRKHARSALPSGIDPCSSARWFDGFAPSSRSSRFAVRAPPSAEEQLTVPPRTWLLAKGWRRRGLVDASEVPAG